MPIVSSERCDACGGTLQLKGGPGRFINYRRDARVEIPSDFEMLTCDACGEIVLDGATADRIEARFGNSTLTARLDEGIAELDGGLGVETTPDELTSEISAELGLDE